MEIYLDKGQDPRQTMSSIRSTTPLAKERDGLQRGQKRNLQKPTTGDRELLIHRERKLQEPEIIYKARLCFRIESDRLYAAPNTRSTRKAT